MNLSTVAAGLIGVAIGALGTTFAFRKSITKVTNLLNEIVGHIMAGTAEEEAKILPAIKTFVAANLHL